MGKWAPGNGAGKCLPLREDTGPDALLFAMRDCSANFRFYDHLARCQVQAQAEARVGDQHFLGLFTAGDPGKFSHDSAFVSADLLGFDFFVRPDFFINSKVRHGLSTPLREEHEDRVGLGR